jgi:hypothetical protein
MQPRYVVAFVPRNNTVLGVAYAFQLSNVNLPWGSVKPDETPIEAAFRLTFEQTKVKPSEARLLQEHKDAHATTYLYYITRFEGRPLPTALGRAFWASEAQLLRPTAEGASWARRFLTLLHRV